jgi:hypothetical protein
MGRHEMFAGIILIIFRSFYCCPVVLFVLLGVISLALSHAPKSLGGKGRWALLSISSMRSEAAGALVLVESEASFKEPTGREQPCSLTLALMEFRLHETNENLWPILRVNTSETSPASFTSMTSAMAATCGAHASLGQPNLRRCDLPFSWCRS